MATLRIWETVRYTKGLPLRRLDGRTVYQAVTFTGTAAASSGFSEATNVITVKADAACAIAVGAAPVATANSFPLAANELLDLAVEPGEKISAITV